jgi:hypothetical protein
MKTHFLIAALVFVSVPLAAQADPRRADLQAGFSVPQVIQLWGEPKEKNELEVKRREIWRYPNGAFVLFSEGKVSEWRLTDAEMAQRQAEVEARVKVTSDNEVAANTDTRDLVREIAKEVPSGPDGPISDSDFSQAVPGTNLMPGQNNMGISPGVQVVPQPIE